MKILNNKKGLSPVVASIILIAVTVAVSIAVAAWMGALSFSFMSSGESLQTGTPWGWVGGATGTSYLYVNVTNAGGSTIELTNATRIGNNAASSTIIQYESATADGKLAPQESAGLRINYDTWSPAYLNAGQSYTITLLTKKGNEFKTTGIVPAP